MGGDVSRRIAPFGIMLLLAFAIVPVGHEHEHAALLAVAIGLVIGLTIVVAATPWGRVGPAGRVAPVLAIFPIIALLRHAEGGAESAFAPLVALPVLWLALYATRRQLGLGLVLGGLVLALPPVVFGAPEYPSSEWPRLAIYALIAPIAGFVINDLVARVRTHTASLEAARARLSATEGSFRAAFGDAPAAQFMCAPTGALLRANDALCALLGVRHDDLFGAEVSDLFEDDEEDRVRRTLLALWHGETLPPSELDVRLAAPRDDVELHAQLSMSLIRSDDGRPLFLLGHVVDITERVRDAREKETRAAAARAVKVATQSVGDSPRARRLVCEAALELTSAEVAVLLEQDERRVLVTTASAGTPADEPAGGLGGRGAHAAAALTSRKPILTALDGGGAGAPGAAVGAALFEPVLRDGEAVGVLAFMWPLRPSQVSDDAIVAAHLLAGETASLLARSDRLETLRRLAHQDGLTGLPNRRMWEEHLPREMARARRDSTPLCVALIDLDEFKAYNDRHGHQAGDRLLRDAASEWRSRLRASDVIARYGGEEFGVLLPGCDLPAALDLLERIRTATPAPATCSIGVAVWDGGETARELLDRADRALYAAKRAGRDRTMLAVVGDRDAAPAGHSAGA